MSETKLSIILPVRNEADSIRIAVPILEAVISVPHEILVVYDFPEDTTVPAVQELRARYRNVRPLHNTLGRGVANAIRTGVREAVGEYIALFAADDIMPVLALGGMTNLLDRGCEFVSGTRYAHGGKRYGGSKLQFLFSWTGNAVFQILSGSVLTDCTTGYKMFRRNVFDKMSIESKAVSWSVVFELGVKAQTHGLKLGEVPIISVDRLYGGVSSFALKKWLKEYFAWFWWGIKELRRSKTRTKIVMRS